MANRRGDGWEVDSLQPEVKRCTYCNEIKPLTEFRKRASAKDGHAAMCKPCQRIYEAAHRALNRDRYLERQQAWYENNPDGRSRHRKKFIAARPYAERIDLANRRARQMCVDGSITEGDWEWILEKYGARCLKCGSDDRVQIDHVIPLTKGGPNVRDNLQPLCQACNKSKRQNIEDYRGQVGG